MLVDLKRDKNNNFENCNLLELNVKELSKIQIALMDYYDKLKDMKLNEDAEVVKNMLIHLDINV